MKIKAIEEIIKMYKIEFGEDSRALEAEAELAVFRDKDMVLVDRRKLKKIEWAAQSEPDMCGDTTSACPACKIDWNFAKKHREGCWLAALIKGVSRKPKRDEDESDQG